MLDHLKKVLNLTEASSVEASSEQVAELNTKLSEVTAKFAEAEQVNLALTEQVSQLASQLTESEALVAELTAKQAAIVADVAKAKADARMAEITEAVGSVKAEGLFAATKDMDDVAYNTVLSAVAASYEAEKESPLFNEVGATCEVDVASVTEKSALEKALEEKYRASK